MERQTERGGHADGVRRYETVSRRRFAWLAALAVGVPIVATVLAVLVIRLRLDEPSSAPAPAVRIAAAPLATLPAPAHAVAPTPIPWTPGRATVRRRAAAAERTAPDEVAERPAGRAPGPGSTLDAGPRLPEVDAADVISALRADGETEGIAAFGVPGTEPPKPGVIVPEGFELPEGFVRHYQNTDDGQQLQAILMVHPDYDLLDAAGNPVATPDGIVPPELVPPGLPLEILEVPERRTRTELPD